jgi:2-polyprenyl-6-methoxyphenol hydroxylase-like FAD-dependent oxidoreductase
MNDLLPSPPYHVIIGISSIPSCRKIISKPFVRQGHTSVVGASTTPRIGDYIMKLLFALPAIALAAAFLPASFAGPSFPLAAASESASAIAAASEASKTCGATSPEARSKIEATGNIKQRVIIVGCSLAGLSVALGLISKDNTVSVEIVERQDTFESRGATFGLARNGQIALEEICPGVLEYLKTSGIFVEKMGAYMLPWWVVRDSLLEEARNHSDRITIRLGMTIQEVIEDDDQVKVTFLDSDLILQGSVLIGADGFRSQIRTEILGLAPATSTGAKVWRGRINTKDIPSLHHLSQIDISRFDSFGSKLLLSYFNFDETMPGTIAWVASSRAPGIIPDVTTPLDLLQQHLEESDENDETEMKKAETAKTVFANSLPRDLTFSSEISVVDLDSGWGGKGRVTLVGDAAHALRPASGLGGAMAFEDAVLLSRMLKTSNNVVATLRAFEAKRLPRVKSISDDQTMRSESAYKKDVTPQPWSDEYRAWIFEGPDATSEPPL